MKSSKLSILLLFLVMILVISVVSAADTNETSDSAVQAVDEAPVEEVASADVDVVAATDNTAVLADPGDKNFTQLQAEIDQSTTGMITLNSNYVRQDGESDIEINKNFNIFGNDVYTIDANNKGGIFKINQGSSVLLNNVVLINGNGINGGAIYNEGTVNIISSTLTGNDASNGGAIYSTGIATISGSTINENTATDKGGAVYSTGNLVVGDGNNFKDNTATYKGGAIYNEGDLEVTGSTFDSNDITNRAGANTDFNGGAAIYNLKGTLTVDNSNFINNVKNYEIRSATDFDNLDGAITSISGTVAISNSEFRNNSARYGSAILISSLGDGADGTFTIDTCQFYDNLALAGAIQVWDRNNKFEFTVLDSWFENNTATGITDPDHTAAGGALALINVKEAKINGTTFKENKVTNIAKKPKGGAINIQDSNVDIDYCTFEANHADTNGGAINVYSGSVDVNNSEFINNDAAINGGAINIDNNTAYGYAIGTATVEGSTFTGNTAAAGNAIYNNGYLALSGNTVDDGANIASQGTITSPVKAVVTADKPEYRIEEVTLTANLTDDNGNAINDTAFKFIFNTPAGLAAIPATLNDEGKYVAKFVPTKTGEYIVTADYVGVINATFTVYRTLSDLADKIAAANGNPVVLDGDYTYNAEFDSAIKTAGGIAIVSDVTIDGNGYTIDAKNATRIFNVKADMNITNVTLTNGYTTGLGAAINIATAGNNVRVTYTTFTNNAARYGSGICDDVGDGSNVYVDHCIFDSNYNSVTDTVFCGAPAIYSWGSLVVNNSVFNNNGLYSLSNYDVTNAAVTTQGDGSIYNSNFTNNKANKGGAICSNRNSKVINLIVDNCRFINNTGYDGGAVLVNTNSKADIKNSYFENNSALGFGSPGYTAAGGAICVVGANSAEIDNCIFKENKVGVAANSSGGAISIENTKVDISDCTFESNSAMKCGGAIDISNRESTIAREVTISNCNFTNNSAEFGDAIMLRESKTELDVSGSNFTDNGAETDYAVYNMLGALKLSGNTVDNMIYSSGEIKSQINVTTYNTLVHYGEKINLTATVTDDNGNLIDADDFYFVINTVNYGPAVFNAATGLYEFEQEFSLTLGTYEITMNSTKFADLTYVEIGNLTAVPKKGTYSDLQAQIDALAPGATLELTYDFAYDASYDADRFPNGVIITKDLTIKGNDHYIDGNNTVRIFASFATVNLNDVVFKNGKATKGGAVYTTGNLNIDNCTFINNTATVNGNDIYVDVAPYQVYLVYDEASYNAAYNGTDSPLYKYYQKYPTEDIDNNDSRGHSWAAAISAPVGATVPAGKSRFPWIVLNMNESFTGAIIVNFNGTQVFGPWNVADKVFAIISVPGSDDCGMVEYALDKDTGHADKELETQLFEAFFANNDGVISATTNPDKLVSVSDSTFSDNAGGYSIYNLGNLKLEGNTISNGVYNEGNITSQYTATVLGNKTVNVNTTAFELNATLTDDSGNNIFDPNFRFTVNGEMIATAPAYSNGVYTFTYDGFTTDIPSYLIGVNASDLDTLVIKTGVVKNILRGTFTDLEQRISVAGTELVLPYDFTYDAEIDGDKFINGILINKDVTINGNGSYISGADSVRIFAIDTFATVNLNNITFRNGKADKGGAIYAAGKLTVDACTFVNNTAVDGQAIYVAREYTVYVIDSEETYDALLNDPTSALNKYYAANPTEDVDPNDPRGHSWAAVKAANLKTDVSELPWIVLNMNGFTGVITVDFNGTQVMSDWNVADKYFGIISVTNPGDCGMKEYALWGNVTEIKKLDAGLFDVHIGSNTYSVDDAITTGVTVKNSVFTDNGDADDNSIYNVGTLSLTGNTIDNFIYNEGALASVINATLIGGEEIPASLKEVVYPNATLTDDNGNAIYDPYFNITINGVKINTTYDEVNKVYTATYTIETAGDKIVSTSYVALVTEGKYIVPKANLTEFLVVVPDNKVPYGENVTVYVSIYGVDCGLNVTDFVVVVNDKEYTVNITDGEGSFNVTGLDPDQYSAFAVFEETNDYNKAYASDSFTVLDTGLEIDVNIDDTTYLDNALIEVFIANDASFTGVVEVYVGSYRFTVPVVDGKGSLSASGLSAGNYTYFAYFNGDDSYGNVTTAGKEFTVGRKPVTIDVYTYDGVDYGDVGKIKVVLKDEAGNIIVDDVELVFTDEEGNPVSTTVITTANTDGSEGGVDLEFTQNLAKGIYNVTVKSENFNFVVPDEDGDIIYVFTSYGDDQGTVEYANGTARIFGPEVRYTPIEVLSNGIEGFVGKIFYIESIAEPRDYWIYQLWEMNGDNLTATDIFVKIFDIYEFTSYGDAEGTVLYGSGVAQVNNDKTKYEDSGFSYVKVLSNDIAGFVGERFHIKSDAVADGATLNRLYDENDNPLDIWVKVSKVDGIYGFESYDSDDPDSSVFYSNGTAKVAEGLEEFRLTGVQVLTQENGDVDKFLGHYVCIKSGAVADGVTLYQLYWEPDTCDNYGPIPVWVKIYPNGGESVTVEYPVHKKYVEAVVTEGNGSYEYGDEHIVVVKLVKDVDGQYVFVTIDSNVTVLLETLNNEGAVISVERLDGTKFENGVLSLNLSALTPGNYKLELKLDNENYAFHEWAVDNAGNPIEHDYILFYDDEYLFTVGKADVVVNVLVDDITYGEHANVTITIVTPNGEKLNATVNVGVYGVLNMRPVELLNGTVTYSIPEILDVGTYTVLVDFLGTENYNELLNISGFTVKKATPEISIVVDDKDNLVAIASTNITITVDEGKASGTILIEGLDALIIADLVDGSYKLENVVLNAGDYNITVTYLGEDNYNGNKANVEFSVVLGKATVEISDEPASITYGDNVTFVVNVITDSPNSGTGNVSVFVDGELIGTVDLDSEYTNASVYVSGLNVGTYNITVQYNGNGNYEPSGNVSFTVTVNAKEIDSSKVSVVIPESNEYGTAIPVTITSPVDGNYTVNVNGTIVTVDVVNGVGTANITGLNAGIYNATVDIADGNYSMDTITTDNFEYLITPEITTVEITGTYPNGNIVIVGTPGNYTVTIDGWEGIINITVPSGLAGVGTIADIAAGNYTAHVRFAKQGDYYEAVKDVNFTIDKATSDVVIQPVENVVYGNPVVIYYEMVNGTLEFATISITDAKGNLYDRTVADGNITVEGLPAGTYTVTIHNPGDDNHIESESSATFDVLKAEVLNIEIINQTTVGVISTFGVNITVGPNATGKLYVNRNGFSYSVDLIEGGYYYFDEELTDEGYYTLDVSYMGDDNYKAAFNSTTLIIEFTNIVTNDTFYGYFDENGILLKDVEFDELIFDESFSNLGVDVITINKPIKISGKEGILPAMFYDMGLRIIADNVAVSNIAFINNGTDFNATNNGAAIYVNGENVALDRIGISYNAPKGKDSYAVYVIESDGFNMTSSIIYFFGNESADNYQYGLRVADSNNVYIAGNSIWASLPAVDVHSSYFYPVSGIDQDLVLAVGIQNGDNIIFTGNDVKVDSIGLLGSNPTIDAIMVDGPTNLEISFNNIYLFDGKNDGAAYYHAVDLYNFEGSVLYNNITVNTTTGVPGSGDAYPIQLSGPYTAVVSGNNLTAISNGPSIGILSYNWAGEADLEVTDNNITVIGSGEPGSYNAITSGIELQVTTAKVYDNYIDVDYIDDAYSDELNVYGISNAQWSTVEFLDIQNNEVYSAGKYAVYIKYAADGTVTGNFLIAYDLVGDEAVCDDTMEAIDVDGNYPADLELIVYAYDVNVTEPIVIDIFTNKLFSGEVTVVINGVHKVDIVGGKGTLVLDSLPANTYTVNAFYDGDKYFPSDEDEDTFEVLRFVSEMTITTGDIVIDQDLAVNITLPGVTDDILVYLDGEEALMSLINGSVTFTIPGMYLDAGNHTIEAIFNGNDLYEPAWAFINVTVEKAENYTFEVNLTIGEITIGDNVTFNVTLPEDANGIITVSVDGKPVTFADVVNGNATVTVPASAFTAGRNNTIDVTYADDKYGNTTVSKDVFVDKLSFEFTATAENIELGQNATIVFNIPDGADGKVYAYLLGEMYPAGNGIITIENLTEGTYTAYVVFVGDTIYKDNQTKVTFNVTKVVIPADEAFNITTPANATAPEFTIKLPEDATGYLLLDINGTQTFVPLVNGTATAKVPSGFAPGNYTAVVTYTGDDKYAPITTEQNITVASNVPDNAFTIPETAKDGEPLTYSINLPSDAKGYLEVDVDGKKYVAALNNGSATITVPGLTAGDHNVTVSYTGDGKYSPVTKSTTVKVPNPVYKITNNKNIAVIYSGKASYKVLVTKDGKAVGAGQSVVITFNGKKYTVKTDKNGYATLNLNTKVKVKSYTITAKYQGVTVKNTVKIKHLFKVKNIKIKKSRKVNKIKVKTYKVNGKYLKGKKLTLKVKGKKVKAKINKKGVAVFKLKKTVTKKLKAGMKYKYSVSYGKDKIIKKMKVKK